MDLDDAIVAELKLMKRLIVLAFAGNFWALFFIVPQPLIGRRPPSKVRTIR